MLGIDTGREGRSEMRIAGLSPDQRRTQKRKALLMRGIHPLMKTETFEDVTCGECQHFYRVLSAHTYFKCDLIKHSHGAATDIRKSWPGCAHFTPACECEEEPEKLEDKPQ